MGEYNQEKSEIEAWLLHPGTIRVARKLRAECKRMRSEYDYLLSTGNFEKAQEYALLRGVIERTIPSFINDVMNDGAPPKQHKWNFGKWLKDRLRLK